MSFCVQRSCTVVELAGGRAFVEGERSFVRDDSTISSCLAKGLTREGADQNDGSSIGSIAATAIDAAWRIQVDAFCCTDDIRSDCADRSHLSDSIDAWLGCREEVRSGRERQRDKGWPNDVLQRTQLLVRGGGPNHRRLLPNDKRPGRYRRTQDQVHLVRRCVQPGQNGGADAQAHRKRRGALHCRLARHRAPTCCAAIHEHEEGATTLHKRSLLALGGSEDISLDDGIRDELSG